MPAIAEVQFKATNSQTVVTAFNSIGTAAGNAGTKVQQFTAGATTKIQQFTSSLNSIKTQGNPLSNLSTNLTGFNKSVDQSSQKVTTFGQKLKGFGSQFGSSIANIGALGGTLVGLTRQYQDLGDSQIAVDKAQLKVSKTTEAVGTAQGKLNDLTAKGVTSGAEYNKALLDVNQAMEAQSLAEQMLTERQEDHQRAQENFWIGLVPTVTTAGASIVSVLNDIGGTKGLGGLTTALKGIGSGTSGLIGGVISAIGGLGGAASGSVKGIGAMTGALGSLRLAMVGVAFAAGPIVIAIAGAIALIKPFGQVIHEFSSLVKGDVLEAVKSVEGLLNVFSGKSGNVLTDLMTQISPASGIMKLIGDLPPLREEITKLKADLEKTGPAATTAKSGLEGLDSGVNGLNGVVEGFLPTYNEILKQFGITEPQAAAAATGIDGLGTSAEGTTPAITGLDTAVTGFWTDLAASTIPQVTTWTSDWNAMMELLNPTLTTVSAAVKFEADQFVYLNDWLNQVVASTNAFEKSTARAKTQTAQLTPVLNKATQALNKYMGAQSKGDFFGHGAGLDFSGGQPQPTRTGAKVSGARNPDFRLRSDYQKATITGRQHGYQGTVKRPTMFIAGEGGRPEDVTVRPRGSAQRGGSGGGVGFSGTINVYVDGVLRPARYDMGARK